MTVTPIKKILLALALASATCTASAQWVLNNAASSVDFISIKNAKIGEPHHFKKLQGSLDKNGKANVAITLASVETLIPIRNERMKTTLFEVDKFPQATVTAVVDFDSVSDLNAGQSLVEPVKLSVSMHGKKQTMTADLRIVKLADDKLLVATVKPIIVNAEDFMLGKGVEALKEIAQLLSVSSAVPVTVSLVFEK